LLGKPPQPCISPAARRYGRSDTRRGGQAARSLTKLLALVAACSATLAICAQTSIADPVTGVLGAVGATATQQLGTVAHDATTTIPLPVNPPPAAAQVSGSAAQSVAALPQPVAGAGATARSGTSSVTESLRTSDSGAGGAGSGSSGHPLSPPPRTLLTVAKRAGHVLASGTPGEHAATVPAVRRIVSSHVGRIASTPADTERHAPVTRTLAGHASRIAGALLGAVADIAASARDTLAAMPVPALTSRPSVMIVAPSLAATDPGGAPNPATEPPSRASLPASFAAAGFAGAGPALAVAAVATPTDTRSIDTRSIGPRASRQPTPSVAPQAGEMNSAATNAAQPRAASHEPSAAAKPMLGEPAPASPAGGFSPASGAGAGGGVSATTYLALAALLLLAAPRALRRLRPTAASWRTAQFALIPARPG
jgi:hypothetical protein